MSDKTAVIWNQIATQRNTVEQIHGWLDSPLLQRLYVQPLTGMLFMAGEGNWLTHLVEQLNIPRNGRWLSIGCGSGGWELFAAGQGLCGSIEGIDLASEAIAIANRAAVHQGITNAHFRVADLEHTRLDHDAYDVILCSMGLHHVERLEYFYDEAVNALCHGGWLILNEFVGPSRWQWNDTQLTAINTLLAALPERYRVHSQSGKIKTREERPTVSLMKEIDPSESVRSAEIVPLLQRQFTITHQRNYGGSILHKLLEYIVWNFDADRPEDVALLNMLCAAEQAFIKTGTLSSDFTVLVGCNTKRSLRSSRLPFDRSIDRHIVSGFYPLESAPDGRSFCWTAPTATFVLDRPAHAQALRLMIRLPPVARHITITVDGAPLGSLQSSSNTNLKTWHTKTWHTVTLMLPASSVRQPTIAIHLDRPWSPADIRLKGDARELGIALAGAEFV